MHSAVQSVHRERNMPGQSEIYFNINTISGNMLQHGYNVKVRNTHSGCRSQCIKILSKYYGNIIHSIAPTTHHTDDDLSELEISMTHCLLTLHCAVGGWWWCVLTLVFNNSLLDLLLQ